MLRMIEITDENVDDFLDTVPEEYVADAGREYCRMLLGIDRESEEPGAAIFWEVRNMENNNADNTAQIRWFFAATEENGSSILDSFIARCGEDNAAACTFELPDLSDNEIAALESRGFKIQKAESSDLHVSVKELSGLPIARKPAPDYVRKLGDLTPFQFKAGIMNSVMHERYGLLDDLPFLPMSRYDLELSCCVATDDKVSGLLLVHRMKKGLYRVELLFSDRLDAALTILNMLRFSIRTAGKCCDPGDTVLVCRHNSSVTELAGKLFPDKKGSTVMKGVRK